MSRPKPSIELATWEIVSSGTVRPLETMLGAPGGRRGFKEGGRTVPEIKPSTSLVSNVSSELVNLFSDYNQSPRFRAILFLTWAEDRALRGRNPSADPGAKTGDGANTLRPAPLLLVSGIGTKAENPWGVRGAGPPGVETRLSPFRKELMIAPPPLAFAIVSQEVSGPERAATAQSVRRGHQPRVTPTPASALHQSPHRCHG